MGPPEIKELMLQHAPTRKVRGLLRGLSPTAPASLHARCVFFNAKTSSASSDDCSINAVLAPTGPYRASLEAGHAARNAQSSSPHLQMYWQPALIVGCSQIERCGDYAALLKRLYEVVPG